VWSHSQQPAYPGACNVRAALQRTENGWPLRGTGSAVAVPDQAVSGTARPADEGGRFTFGGCILCVQFSSSLAVPAIAVCK
jgi:hypothetical protein